MGGGGGGYRLVQVIKFSLIVAESQLDSWLIGWSLPIPGGLNCGAQLNGFAWSEIKNGAFSKP